MQPELVPGTPAGDKLLMVKGDDERDPVELAGTVLLSEGRVEEAEAVARQLGDIAPATGRERGRPDRRRVVALESAADLTVGTKIGKYEVIGEIGTGGMGVVVSAYDPELDRKVAIKLLKTDQWTSAGDELGGERLMREAKAMARLSHANVVAVHEVGRSGDRLFIAMELVEGDSLAGWLATEPRAWPDIVAKFVAAGRGLAAAHAAGLVHRDFKPDNVLIGSDGRARVTDFGLVSASGAEFAGDYAEVDFSGELSTSLTRTGVLLGTPNFMAPEQFEKRTVDARSDQFAFCVALYQALYGVHPFAANSLRELSLLVTRGRVTPPPEDSEVPARLGEIVLRGLRVRAGDRHESMKALLALLEADPREATRRRRLFGLAALFALLAAVALFLSLRSRTAGVDCDRAADKLGGVWDDSRKAAVERAFAATKQAHAGGVYARVERYLDDYSRKWVGARREACRATHRDGQQSQAELDLRMRCLDRRLAALAALVEVLAAGPDDGVLARAVTAATSLGPIASCADTSALAAAYPLPEDPALREQVIRLGRQLARVEALESAGKYQDGLVLALEVAGQASRTDFPPLEAEALFEVANLHDRAGDAGAAEANLRAALKHSALARNDKLTAHIWIELLWVVGDRQARHSEVGELRSAATAAVARVGASDLLRLRMANVLGSIYEDQGDYAVARRHYEEALSIAESFTTAHPDVPVILNNLGNVLDGLADYEQAQAMHQRALVLWEGALGPDHPYIAAALVNLGTVLWRRGELDPAEKLFVRALAIDERVLGPEHLQVAESLSGLASVLHDRGELERARALLERALAIREHHLGDSHPDVAAALSNLGLAQFALGELPQARASLERALAIQEKLVSPDHPDVGMILGNLALVILNQGELDAAQTMFERALAIKEKALGPDHPDVGATLANLGEVAKAKGNHARAVDLLERAMAIFEKALGPSHPNVGLTLGYLGAAAMAGGERTRACDYYRRSLALTDSDSDQARELEDTLTRRCRQ